MKLSGPGLLFAGRFLITVSISVLVMDIGYLGLVHWDDPEGGEGREEGGGFRMGNAGIPVADSF